MFIVLPSCTVSCLSFSVNSPCFEIKRGVFPRANYAMTLKKKKHKQEDVIDKHILLQYLQACAITTHLQLLCYVSF